MIYPEKFDEGKLITLKAGTASSTTISKYDMLAWASGYVTPATSATTEVRLLAMQDVVTGSAAHEDILCLMVEGVNFLADTASNTAASQRGTYVDLTDEATINNGATSNNVFYIKETIGAVADKKVRGVFVQKID